MREVLSDGLILDLDKSGIARSLKENVAFMTLPLPDGKGGTIELELVKVNIFAPGFSVKTAEPSNELIDESMGIHYRGIVKGNDRSLAAISIFHNEVMGFFSTEADGNSILGRLGGNNPTDEHVLYAERDLKVSSPFHCDTQGAGMTLPESVLQDPNEVMARCIRIYIEADYDLFLNKGSVANTTSYLTGVFNQSATLYSNDGIPISLSEILVWNVQSPYAGLNTPNELLGKFQEIRNSFNGDIGHLVAIRGGGGVAPSLNAFCNTNIDERQCFSGINPTYNNVPTYSWTIEVFTHEMGHLMGSPHTQACAWNGNNTAIDGCAPPEGSCSRPGIPPEGGTIMSYCHQQSVGINFTLGFGVQPRNLIVGRFNAATCLSDCGGGCTYNLNPTSRSFSASSSSSSFTVTTGSSCSWTATVNAPSMPQTSMFSKDANPLSLANVLNIETNGPNAPEAAFLNSTPISIPSSGAGAPYPSTISVSGQSGTVTKVSMILNRISHAFADDVGVLLVGPTGVKVRIMTDIGGSGDFVANDVTFDDTGSSIPDNPTSAFANGSYRPTQGTNINAAGSNLHSTNFLSPAPASPYSLTLSSFNGQTANGTWSLYVDDDSTGDSGVIEGGWGLFITTGSGGSSWINITSGSSGTGNGTVNYSVAANTGASQRTGTITVNGQVHTVTQAGTGGGCTYSLSPTSQSFGSGGGSNNASVTAGSGCAWTAVSNSSFINITAGSSGSGNGTVSYSVSSNSSTSQRTGTMTIAGQTFNVTQSGSSCSYSLFPTSQSFGSVGESNNVSVTAGSGCAWTAVSNSSFITINSGSSGSGNGTVSYSVSANSSTSQRTGTMTIAGQTFNVTQSGSSCSYSLSPTSQSFGSGGGSNNVSVTAGSGCAWTAVSNSSFINITAGSSGSGNGTVSYSVSANSSTSQRTGTMTIAGQSFAISQDAASNGNSTYDVALKAPKCGQAGSACDSGNLLNGRDSISGGQEPNQPNTIYNSCADNTAGTYHADESIDRIKVSTLDGTNLAPGKTVKIEVTVWAFSATDDFLDLFYAPDATNPNWTYITTIVPSVSGAQVLSTTYTLPTGSDLQALRANFLYQGAATSCSGGSGNYDDHDDLIFAASSSVTRTLTVASANPSSGVSITVSPNDNSNLGSGTTQFTRTYNNNTIVNLTAPSSASGNNFQKWQRDGADWSFSLSTSVTMDANHSLTAVYQGVNTSGLQYYPLAYPVRLLDTRPGETACFTPGTPLSANSTRTQVAIGTCGGLTIPATAKAIVGNGAVVNTLSGATAGHVTVFPSGVTRPVAANVNYAPGDIISNGFTVGLGTDGAFNIYAYSSLHFVVDITGYYAPPGQGGLYYHPLPRPLRLLDTRSGEPACDTPGVPIQGGTSRLESTRTTCGGIVLPSDALALVGNAAVVNTLAGATAGYVTLYPGGVSRPATANGNYAPGQIISNGFTVGLAGDGTINIFAYSTLHFVLDVTGYFSASALPDANGISGLLYYPLPSPMRLLDTRAGQPACVNPGSPLAGNTVRTQVARLTCGSITVPVSAQAVVGNAAVVNNLAGAGVGYIAVYPSGVSRPPAANVNYAPGQVVSNTYTVGLGSDGAFNIYAYSTLDFVTDISGYFAP